MTCAGLKSLIYAGVSKSDLRAQAAMRWLQDKYTLDANPGMANPRSGLFFYDYSFAKTMNIFDEDLIIDERGVKHDWREELTTVLLQSQRPGGSWGNSDESERMFECHPVQITTYATQAFRQRRDGPEARSFSSVSIQKN